MSEKKEISLATAASVAAIAYLVMIVVAPFSYGYVYSGLVIPDDALTTIANIQAHDGLFRTGISLFILVVLADVVVAWGLYYYLAPVNKALSLLAAWLRIIYVAIFAAGLNNLFELHYFASDLIGQDSSLLMHEHDVVVLSRSFDNGWLIGLVFFGFHLLLIGNLIVRADYMPKLLGWLVAIAGLAYIFDSFAHFLLNNYKDYKDLFMIVVMIPATIGEFYLCLWLFIKGKAAANLALPGAA